jgi:hypothetical protein
MGWLSDGGLDCRRVRGLSEIISFILSKIGLSAETEEISSSNPVNSPLPARFR